MIHVGNKRALTRTLRILAYELLWAFNWLTPVWKYRKRLRAEIANTLESTGHHLSPALELLFSPWGVVTGVLVDDAIIEAQFTDGQVLLFVPFEGNTE